MSADIQKDFITASTLLNAAVLIEAILVEVLGNAVSTNVNGLNIDNNDECVSLVSTSLQASLAEHLG